VLVEVVIDAFKYPLTLALAMTLDAAAKMEEEGNDAFPETDV